MFKNDALTLQDKINGCHQEIYMCMKLTLPCMSANFSSEECARHASRDLRSLILFKSANFSSLGSTDYRESETLVLTGSPRDLYSLGLNNGDLATDRNRDSARP